MKCPACGREVSINRATCNCGQDLTGAALKGFGGWLIFFSLTLFIGVPIRSLAIIGTYFEVYKTISSNPNPVLDFPVPSLIGTVVTFQMIAWSVASGVVLVMVRRPWAVRFVKIFLLAIPIEAIVLTEIQAYLVPNAASQLWTSATSLIFSGMGYCAIWYAYLSRSRRVKQTYLST